VNATVAPELVDLAQRLADAAGEIALRYFRSELEVHRKPNLSPVTAADREIERTMRGMLSEERPGDGILGEEYGGEGLDAEHLWILDPIDGTRAFITGRHSFGTLIALYRAGRPVLGLIDHPSVGERWLGVSGRASLWNGAPVTSRRGVSLERAALMATHPGMFRGADEKAFGALAAAVELCEYGCDCYAYGLLASGHVDLVCEAGLAVHDWAALVPVVQGAGGRISDWQGRPLGLASDGRVLASGDPELHATALKLLTASGATDAGAG
jgi:histidinol phosphatase-like enzyme (inositol monophosphatase family)